MRALPIVLLGAAAIGLAVAGSVATREPAIEGLIRCNGQHMLAVSWADEVDWEGRLIPRVQRNRLAAAQARLEARIMEAVPASGMGVVEAMASVEAMTAAQVAEARERIEARGLEAAVLETVAAAEACSPRHLR